MRPIVLTVLGACLVVAGCSGEEAVPPYVFNSEGDAGVECMAHQEQPPGESYTVTEQNGLGRNLAVLRYYVDNGSKPYCDGAGPTDADRQWAQFYLEQTSNREPVAAILDAP